MPLDPRIISAHTSPSGELLPPLEVGNNGEIDYDYETRIEMATRRVEINMEAEADGK